MGGGAQSQVAKPGVLRETRKEKMVEYTYLLWHLYCLRLIPIYLSLYL
jgi:hypothetical protein